MTGTERMRRLLALYGIVDPQVAAGRDPATLAGAAVAGGVTLMQYRDKKADDGEMSRRAGEIAAAMAGSGVPLLINDRVELAGAIGADGVHLGQDDMTPQQARQLLGPEAIIGLTVKTEAQARAAPLDVLDYVCIGGVFTTSSKENPDAPVGVGGVGRICDAVRARRPGFPVAAIAGIDGSNAADVIAAGVDGVAVISAIMKAADVEAAARDLRRVVEDALRRRGQA